MEKSVLIGGSGGQGVMLLGTMLAIAAIHENKQSTCMPAYGPEMRGGTANCTVIVGEDKIVTPLPDEVSSVIVMNELSYHKFVGQVPENGLLIGSVGRFGNVMRVAPPLTITKEIIDESCDIFEKVMKTI